MKINVNKKWFSLVELLVVITILAIISVVAYQNFGWAVDKATSGRKISDVSTIETSLQQFKVDNNYYPAVGEYDSTNNMWWYNSGTTATPSNTLGVTMNGAEIQTVDTANGWWTIVNTASTQRQIGAKWTISQEQLGKNYLTKDLYDPEIWDLTEKGSGEKLIDKWIGRYVYAIYRKPSAPNWGSNNKTGTYYNIAYTIKKEASDTYLTRIVWDYDSKSCFDDAPDCPDTLIGWNGSVFLVDEQEKWTNNDWSDMTSSFGSRAPNQWIPYSVNDFE